MTEEDEIIKAECLFCGVSFEPHPDSYVETGYTKMHVDEVPEGIEGDIDIDLESASEYHLTENGLDAEAAKALLEAPVGEHVATGGGAVCDACLKQHFGYDPQST